jgi:hypothetical protein
VNVMQRPDWLRFVGPVRELRWPRQVRASASRKRKRRFLLRMARVEVALGCAVAEVDRVLPRALPPLVGASAVAMVRALVLAAAEVQRG